MVSVATETIPKIFDQFCISTMLHDQRTCPQPKLGFAPFGLEPKP